MHRIGLLGGECTGKSTMAAALASTLPGTAVVVPEVVRAFVTERGRSPHLHEQADIMAQQVLAEDRAMNRAGVDVQWLIADPAPAMTAIYSMIYFGDESLLEPARAHLLTYDTVLWCDRDVPWVPDPGQRDGTHMRDAAHEAIAVAFPDVTTQRISGSPLHRIDMAQRIMGLGV